MKAICWKRKTLKQLSVNKKRKSAGRNSSGTITSYHRGGGSKRLLRRIDSKRNVFLFEKSMKGIVRRIEYDPNRSSRIALIQWHFCDALTAASKQFCSYSTAEKKHTEVEHKKTSDRTFESSYAEEFLKEKVDRMNRNKSTTSSPSSCSWNSPAAFSLHNVLDTNHKKQRLTAVAAAPPVIYSSDVLNLNIKGQAQTQTLNNSKDCSQTPYCYLPTKNTVDKKHLENKHKNKNNGRKPAIFSYILACDQLQLGDTIMNLENKKTQGSYKLRTKKTQLQPLTAALTGSSFKAVLQLNTQLTQQSSVELAKTETLNDTQHLATCPKKKTTVQKKTSVVTAALTTLSNCRTKKNTQNNAIRSNATAQQLQLEEATSVQQKELHLELQLETQKKTGNFCSEQLQNCFEDAIQNTLPFQGIVIRKKAAEKTAASSCSLKNVPMHDTFYQKPGNSIPLYNIAIGTFIYNIEINPGQGGKLVKAAGTFAQLVQQFQNTNQCLIRLPSGITKLLDSRCQATIGTVSNIGHAMRKLTKAGQNRWLGKRPVVRGVAMNPVDHPHGGGEGRTKGGRPSVSPWGKPTKGGFKTVPLSKKKLQLKKQ